MKLTIGCNAVKQESTDFWHIHSHITFRCETTLLVSFVPSGQHGKYA